LRSQYAAVGAAGLASLPQAVAALENAAARLSGCADFSALVGDYSAREENIARFVSAYRRYCWPVSSLDDFKLAPFHLLATEGSVHSGQTHVWHLDELAKLCQHDQQLLLATPYKVVDVTDRSSQAQGAAWWSNLTSRGGEGMVVKPLEFIFTGRKGLAQPGVKCRGREYLRIIYGADYTSDHNLSQLRKRSLGRKRSLALREFALGIEGLERFVRHEPLRRVHECAFGVLALESEPVDPRL
jgi:protein phosphatase